MKKLLLIDSAINASPLIDAKKSDVDYIIFNQELVVFVTATCISLTKIKITKIKTDIKIYFFTALLMAFIIFLALLFLVLQ